MTLTTRFAPSPTGPLHLGHAYSAIMAHDLAQAQAGRFLLRIEDIDQGRSRAHWETQIYDDLAWLGLRWEHPVMRQSDNSASYAAALDALWELGVLYPCTCNRRDIMAAAAAPQEGAALPLGPDGVIYPGTCRHKTRPLSRPTDIPLRLDMENATRQHHYEFIETGAGPDGETGRIVISRENIIRSVGDPVLSRREMGSSYHLSVVVDDAAQCISHVTRGRDLFEATQIHLVLQDLLGALNPIYHHHDLIRDEHGKRLSKRDDARALSKFRADGLGPTDIRRMIGLT